MQRLFMNTFDIFAVRNWLTPLFYGLSFIFLGIIIMLVPEILVAFIASIFLLIGGFLLFIAYKTSKSQKNSDHIKIHIME